MKGGNVSICEGWAWAICVTALIILFAGDPDIHDAIIQWINRL